MKSALLRLTASLCGVLAGCPGEPSIEAIDSGLAPPDLSGGSQDPQLRVTHFIAGLGPFDVCLKGTNDAAFRGPLIREQTLRNGGVFYGSVSAYLTLPASSYTVRVVGGMATSCATQLLPFDITLPAISAGRRYTVLAASDGERMMGKLLVSKSKLALIEDDIASQGGQVRLRFVNGSPDVSSADFGSGEMAAYQPLFTNAAYGTFGAATGSGGPYKSLGAQTNATFTVRPSGMSSDLLVLRSKVSLAAGSATTVFLVGLQASVDATVNPLKLVQCEDDKPASMGLAICAEVTP
jgi:hypothetical protein